MNVAFWLTTLTAVLLTSAALADSAPPIPSERVVLLTHEDHAALRSGSFASAGPVTGDTHLDAVCRDVGVATIERYYPGVLRRPGLARLADRLRVVHLAPGSDAELVAAALSGVPGIEAAEIPVPARLFYTPNDPAYASQWFLPHIGAPEAWDLIRAPATSEAIVAMIDTGIDLDEPDLAPSLWVNELEDLNGNGRLDAADLDGIDQDGNGLADDVVGWDFAANDPNPQETHAHGSAVSACVSAATDNGIGGASIGFGVRVMTLKGIADGGVLVDGYVPMLYAADNGAKVVNCSWGIPVFRVFEQAIVDAVWDEDVVVVAAGGEGEQIVYPAAYDHVFAVSATDATDHRAPFGPYGDTIDICAPGVNILTIWDGALTVVSGTSFASGMVAGVAGLVRAGNPAATAEEVVAILESTAVDLDALNPSYAGQLGAGRIDAYAAVSAATTSATPFVASGRSLHLRCEPNPTFGATVVRFELDRDDAVELDVFDVRGRRVARLARGVQSAGAHDVAWDALETPPGVYYVRLRHGSSTEVRSLSIVR